MANRYKIIFRSAILLTAFGSLLMLIFCSFSLNIQWHLYCATFLGFTIGVQLIPYIYKTLDETKIIELAGLIIGILGLISPLIIYLNKEILDNTFNKQETCNINNLFKSREETHFIFGFDKTEYKDSPTIDSNNDLLTYYSLYINEIKRYKNDISKQTKHIKYREFCRAKMCHDLIRLVKYKGKFSIYFFGTNIDSIVYNKEIDIGNISWAIQKIFENNFDNATETHLKEYYTTINYLVKSEERDKYSFSKYILFTYSDFILDMNGASSINLDLINIRKLREGDQNTYGLKQYSIIENLFILPPPPIIPANSIYALKDENSLNERRTYVSKDITESQENGNATYNLKYFTIHLTYSQKENSSPNLEFTDSLCKLKLDTQKEEFADIMLVNSPKNEEYPLDNITYRQIKSKGIYTVKFKGLRASNQIAIDIVREDIHILLGLDATENKMNKNSIKIIIVMLFFMFGICIPYSFSKISVMLQKYIKNSYESLSSK